MKVLPITNKFTPIAFGTKKGEHITKRLLENRSIKPELKRREIGAVATVAIGLSSVYLDEKLKSIGISYCSADNDTVNICSDHNRGFFKIKTNTHFINGVKEFVIGSLIANPAGFGGLINYMEMVNDLKRQDIIQKGLKIHTYELNNETLHSEAEKAASKLSKFTGKKLLTKDLFYIGEDAFYYDELKKTAYGVNITSKSSVLEKDAILTCEFILDNNGCAVGYNCNAYDSYKRERIDTHYKEQSEPSLKLKSVAEPENNREFAEAFRFGNSTKTFRMKEGIPKVLEHLEKRARIANPTEDKLQIVKFFDKDKYIQSRICYYDPTRGKSFVYTPEGKYMYQLEYNRDPQGNIIAFNHL